MSGMTADHGKGILVLLAIVLAVAVIGVWFLLDRHAPTDSFETSPDIGTLVDGKSQDARREEADRSTESIDIKRSDFESSNSSTMSSVIAVEIQIDRSPAGKWRLAACDPKSMLDEAATANAAPIASFDAPVNLRWTPMSLIDDVRTLTFYLHPEGKKTALRVYGVRVQKVEGPDGTLTRRCTIDLRGRSILIGQVTCEGSPHRGVSVAAWSMLDGAPGTHAIGTESTDQDGLFALDLEGDADVVVAAFSPGWLPASHLVSWARGTIVDAGVLELWRGASISGTVTRRDQAMKGVKVIAVDADLARGTAKSLECGMASLSWFDGSVVARVEECVTDGEGRFRFVGLRDAVHGVRAKIESEAGVIVHPSARRIGARDVRPPAENVDIVVDTALLALRVRSGEAPVGGFDISVVGPAPDHLVSVLHPAQSVSSLTMGVMSGEEYFVNVTHDDYAAWQGAVRIPSGSREGSLLVDLVPLPRATVEIRLVDDQEGAIREIRLRTKGEWEITSLPDEHDALLRQLENCRERRARRGPQGSFIFENVPVRGSRLRGTIEVARVLDERGLRAPTPLEVAVVEGSTTTADVVMNKGGIASIRGVLNGLEVSSSPFSIVTPAGRRISDEECTAAPEFEASRDPEARSLPPALRDGIILPPGTYEVLVEGLDGRETRAQIHIEAHRISECNVPIGDGARAR